MPGSVVDLSGTNLHVPDVIMVDTSILVERLLASFPDGVLPSTVAVNAERARWFFRTLASSGGIGLVTPTVFTEFIHAAIKARYKYERRRLGATALQTYGRPINDWLALYKLDPTILQTYLPVMMQFRLWLTLNGLLILGPEDLTPLDSGRTHGEELVRLVGRYGLDSGDAAILLEARRVNVTDIVTLDADLRRAQSDFTIYTWL